MSDKPDLNLPDVVEGVVEHLLHVSYDERTVLRLTSTANDDPSITVIGKALFGVRPGESVRVSGRWTHHLRYGRQFMAERCNRTMPSDERSIRMYLASGMIRGIGPALAGAIVDRFGDQTLKIINTEVERLLEVHNIGDIRLARISEAWQEQKSIAEIMVFLQGLNITPALAVKIYTVYADTDDDPMHIVRHTPYQLCRDVRGIGFDKADKIALAVGVPKHSDERLQAALTHELDLAAGQAGHCHLPVRVLLSRTRTLLKDDDPATAELLDDVVLRHALKVLRDQGEVITEILPLPARDGNGTLVDTEIAVLPRLHRDETQLAQRVRRLVNARSLLAEAAPWADRLAGLTTTETAGLTEEQHHAILTALTSPISILTGGPGCGKTHALRTLVEIADEARACVVLAAPPGKAAKRLEETTGRDAMTVHRLIRPADGHTLFDHSSPLDSADLIVIDEASMLDVNLARKLTAVIRDGCHLLLVGDVNQLPSVGPGRVLRDLLDVAGIPRTRLTRVFRQHDDSAAIVRNAHRILRGDLPEDDRNAFWNRHVPNPEEVAQRVVDLVADIMPRHFGVPPTDIQFLCPGKKNIAGMTDLNLRLQLRFNPPADDKPQHYHDGIVFRLGDQVQQIRNNPKRGENGIFNGSSGTVTAIDLEAHRLTVTFHDSEQAIYPFAELDELIHAYALTVHRSQGSEYPYVIVPVIRETGDLLLQRNLLYTAVTRARHGVLLIGHAEAVERAIANNRTLRRNTALTHRVTVAQRTVPVPRRNTATGQLAWD
ncbi:ATP-dependent RecD-like DNA helicase [Streptomyces sp. MspMP-M5]|uniref:SF1B family DNA helicase RecD2 n=1 Tax=unclassified Streptomyces TaxID=2593676 RepID=UPI00037C8840|nr:ATP-dependent RecD-like DNA helicase [Streptomyces sp. MspMP-M5]MYT32944.1 ATP-dependent RecD-like DNA helicase [Streptomyces sp. SID8354]